MHSAARMKRIIGFVYIPLAALYLILSYVYPTDPSTIAQRHFSVAQARVVALTFAAIFIIIWVLAFYSSWKLMEYGQSIKEYQDGKAFVLLAFGMFVLALYLPFRSITKILLNYSAHVHPGLTTASIMFISYTNVLIPLVVYIYISRGGQRLFSMVRAKVPSAHIAALALLLSVICAMYCYAIFTSRTKLTPVDWLITVNYAVRAPLLILTLVVPFLFMWSIGLIATYQIYHYHRKVKGVIYRDCLRLLSIGLTLEILAEIAAQYITALAASVRRFPSVFMALLVFTVLLVIAIAYVLIVQGVKKLRAFEEVV